jgi:hypothetical protein
MMDFQPIIDSIRFQLNESLERLRFEDKIEKYTSFINEEIDIKLDSIIHELYQLKEEFRAETQRILRLCKSVENPSNKICFKFVESSMNINKSLIGSIEYPEYLNFTLIKNTQIVSHDLMGTLKCVQFNDNLIILDTLSSELRVFNFYGESIEGLLPSILYKQSSGLCVDQEEQTLYIQNGSQFTKFNHKYNNLSKFTNNTVKNANYLLHDQVNDCLFASITSENKVVYFDHNIVEREAKIDSPKYIKLTEDSVYVIGNESIYELHRQSLITKQQLNILDNQQPIGIHIDSNDYIYTLINKQDHILFLILDNKGRLVHRFLLECNQIVHDFFIVDNKKLIILFDKVFFIIDFE